MKKHFINSLSQKFFIRMHMSLILMVTFASAMAFSKISYSLGWHDLTSRYLLGFLFSYAVFLGTIRCWLWYIFKIAPENNTDLSDADFLDLWIMGKASPVSPAYKGGGGGFSGGGASSSWEDSANAVKNDSGLSLKDLDIGDADEAAPILLVIALVVFVLGLVFGGVYIIVEAPMFLGEIAFDLALTAGIIKANNRKDHPVSWLQTALSKTWIPVVVISILILILGNVIHSYNPEITRSGELLNWITNM